MIDDTATVRTPPEQDGPLLVVLHGYGANERDLAPLLGYLGHRSGAAFLRAPLALGPRAWAWFPISLDPATATLDADRGEVEAASAHLLAWLDAHADGREVVLLGFSQGGALALHLARTHPERVRAVVALSAFVVGPGDAALTATDEAFAAHRLPVFFGHGDADVVVPLRLTEATSRWLAAHTALTERSYPGLPHAVDGRELADVRTFLSTHTKE